MRSPPQCPIRRTWLCLRRGAVAHPCFSPQALGKTHSQPTLSQGSFNKWTPTRRLAGGGERLWPSEARLCLQPPTPGEENKLREREVRGRQRGHRAGQLLGQNATRTGPTRGAPSLGATEAGHKPPPGWAGSEAGVLRGYDDRRTGRRERGSRALLGLAREPGCPQSSSSHEPRGAGPQPACRVEDDGLGRGERAGVSRRRRVSRARPSSLPSLSLRTAPPPGTPRACPGPRSSPRPSV